MPEVVFQFSDGDESVVFTDDVWATIEQAAAVEGVSVEEFITRAISTFVARVPVILEEP